MPERIRQAGAVAYRLEKQEPRFLLVTSRRDPSKWIFPKGHIEDGETAAACAVRELREEAGAAGHAVKALATLMFDSGDETVEVKYFLVEALDDGDAREGRKLKWLSARKAIEQVSHDESKGLLEKAAQELGARI